MNNLLLKKEWSQAFWPVEDVIYVLNSFVDWLVLHTRREANQDTHVFIQKALSLQENYIILEEISIRIQSIISLEIL